jgi:hypothetical protein
MAVYLTRSDCKGFKKCSVSSVMNESDDRLWNDSEEDENISSEYERDEGTDCEGGDSDADW